MAYSPSLESIEVLTKTELPIVVLDTTYTPEYNHDYHAGFITFNHGIHGVMDMCSMLKRYGKPYAIAAGHADNSDVIDRACGLVKSAVAAKDLKTTKVARVGGSFAGMKEGKGVYVNISRDADDFQIFAAECEIVDRQPDEFTTAMHG